MALVSKKPVALSVGSITIDQRVVENPLMEDKNKRLMCKTRENTKVEK